MSYMIGMNAMTRQFSERLAHTEYCDHYPLVRAVTGKDPLKDNTAWRDFYDAWDVDFIWSTNPGPIDWQQRGRTTDMGHAEFMENGSDRRDTVTCPFKDVEEVYAFDAVEEYGLWDMEALITYYESLYQERQRFFPNQVVTGGYYNTLVSGAIQAFGWDLLLEAAADPRRFDRVLEGIFQQSLHHARAWAKTSIEVYIQHDDMVWTSGPFMRPTFYRQSIFPRFKKLWDVLHDAGKIVLFCSDGDFTPFIDDIAAAGADGFIFEPLTSLEAVVERYGKNKVIMGSKVDCRTLTFHGREAIQHEIDETLKIAEGCPGFVFAIGNHMPANIPIENALFYMDYLREHWKR
ncbi:MAG TPA: uroporphyrinogen decarboxylase family protein [Anaerolineaceae bacterium]